LAESQRLLPVQSDTAVGLDPHQAGYIIGDGAVAVVSVNGRVSAELDILPGILPKSGLAFGGTGGCRSVGIVAGALPGIYDRVGNRRNSFITILIEISALSSIIKPKSRLDSFFAEWISNGVGSAKPPSSSAFPLGSIISH